MYYSTFGQFQKELKDYYLRTGNRMQFPEMSEYLYKKGLLQLKHPSDSIQEPDTLNTLSDDDFNQLIDPIVISLHPSLGISLQVNETDIIPSSRDVYIIRHPRYTRPCPHMHNYFEINYVASGQCTFSFEKENRILKEGELCIIAPNSKHDLIIDDESTIFCIMLRKSTFNTTFFSLLTQKDLLSYFFRTILQGDGHANYLLFFSENSKKTKDIIRNAMLENHKRDAYSNINTISWINLLFSNLLRNYSKTLQFYDYKMGSDFSLVLQYIQHNYRTLTLSSLAKFFHYSEPHLCTLIKQNTGHNFSELIRQLKLADALSLLTKTNLKIAEIAENVGYHSADHFSRIFRGIYHMSPQEYRKMNQKEKDEFIPFQ